MPARAAPARSGSHEACQQCVPSDDARSVERDRGSVGDIEALHGVRDRQPRQSVAMFAAVLAEARSLGPKHQRDLRRTERGLEVRLGLTGKPDPPEAGLADLLQRPGEIDDTDPRHALKRTGSRLGERPAFRRRMAVLSDDRDGAERGGGAQDGAQIMWVGHLVEDEEYRALRGVGEYVIQPRLLERLDFDD